ncbi:MAG: glycosyltransferase family 2 protein [Bacilli bacterium]|nr:glycosyltransferase family 2 protein [Bacilli bacterium]
MTKTPLFSIIIPTKDPDIGLLSETLASIRRQSGDDFEIIIIGFFTSAEKRKEVETTLDQGIIFTISEVKGPSAQRNMGVSLAKGEYIIFVDDDDLISSDFLHACREAIAAETPDLICFQYTTSRPALSNQLNNYQVLESNETIRDLFTNLRNPVKPTDTRCVWAKAFSTKVIRTNNLTFDNNLFIAEDMTFCLLFSMYASKAVCYSSEGNYGYYYRQRQGSATYKYDPEAPAKITLFLDAYASLLTKFGIKFDDFYFHICNQSIYNLAISFYFHKENQLSFFRKSRYFKKALKRGYFAEAIKKVPVHWMQTRKKKILLQFLKMHCYLLASIMLYKRYD